VPDPGLPRRARDRAARIITRADAEAFRTALADALAHPDIARAVTRTVTRSQAAAFRPAAPARTPARPARDRRRTSR
jgi:hypothetical protein